MPNWRGGRSIGQRAVTVRLFRLARSSVLAADLFVALMIFVTVAEAADTQIIKGRCTAQSHVAEGRIQDDLTKRQSRFFCDAAVITVFDNNPNHVMVQFADSKSHHGRQIGFARIMESDGQILNVANVYLEPATPTPAISGFCKFFFEGKHMHSIACGARIEEGDRATVPVVTFEAAQEQ